MAIVAIYTNFLLMCILLNIYMYLLYYISLAILYFYERRLTFYLTNFFRVFFSPKVVKLKLNKKFLEEMMMMMLLFKIIFLYCFEPMVLFQSKPKTKQIQCALVDYVYIYIDFTIIIHMIYIHIHLIYM